jgi:alpha-ketoglutarate-dependent taurine dioxygenase
VGRPHDVVIWDNGRSMHTADYGDARREMRRILVRGTVAV